MGAEERNPTLSIEVISQSNSDSDYCLHRPTVSVFPAERGVTAALQTIDLFEQETEETDAIITIIREQIPELKDRQDWVDRLLDNLFYSYHGKPVVTCMAM